MKSAKKSLNNFKITTLKDLEKEFATIQKIFVGKETEANWEARDLSVKYLRSVLVSNNLEEFKDYVVKGLHDNMASIVKSIHSLRTSVAVEALSLIIDMSQILGNSLDQYTMETLLNNLLKCSSVTKKMIAAKASETTNVLLRHTSYYTKMNTLLCETITEKNVQLRQFAATYLQTLLETHGAKETVRSMMESNNSHRLIHQFLKKGLGDASPDVRNACRHMYWTYHQFWSQEAEKLCKSLDSTIRRLIEKSKTSSASQNIIPITKPKSVSKLLIKRSNSTSSVTSRTSSSSSSSSSSHGGTTAPGSITPTPTSKVARPTPFSTRSATPTPSTSATSSNTAPLLFKKPALKKTTSAPSATKPVTLLTRKQTRIPAISAGRLLETQKLSRLSQISNVSAPATTVTHQLQTMKATAAASARRTQSEYHQQSMLATATLLHMLKSNDTQMLCKGIYQLSDSLKSVVYDPTQKIALPSNVPSKLDLSPLLMDLLTGNGLDLKVYRTLMSWESLAGIFVHVLSVNHYCPTLIIAHGLKNNATRKEAEIMFVYSKGLKRIKMFLKRNDNELAQKLLDILQSVAVGGDQRLLDSSIRKDIQLFPAYKTSLVCGLLNWMDEIICDYIGLPEDEDDDMLLEGSKWLHVTDDTCSAGQWFDINAHVQTYLACVIQLLSTNEKEIYTILCNMLGHLKMANQRVFETELKNLVEGPDAMAAVEKALGLVKDYDEFSISFTADDTSILLDEACGIATDDVVIQDVEPQMRQVNESQDHDMMDVEKQQVMEDSDPVKVFDDNSEITQDVDDIKLTDHTNTLVAQEPHALPMSMDTKLDTKSLEPIPEKSDLNNENPPPKSTLHKCNAPPSTTISPLRSMSKHPQTPISTPTRRVSNLEDDDNVQKRKKQKTYDSILNGIQLLKHFISAPLPTAQEYTSLFSEIQQLSLESAQFWSQKGKKQDVLLFATLDALCQLLMDSESNRMNAMITIKMVLENQSGLLKTLDTTAFHTEIFNLTKWLIMSHDGDLYSNTNEVVKGTIAKLASCRPSEDMLHLFWEMSNDTDILTLTHDKGEIKRPFLEIVLLNMRYLVPHVPEASLKQYLEKYGFDLIKKNMNDEVSEIRRATTVIITKMHKRLGNTFYKNLKVHLTSSQMHVIDHFLLAK